MDRWRNKVAVVTGAASGNGAAIVEKFVAEGLQVVGLDVDQKKLDELSDKLKAKHSDGGRFYKVKCDVSNEEDILQAFKWTTDNVGPVQILINNAGVAKPGTLLTGETEQWRKVFEVNVLAVAVCSREAVKIMRQNGIDDGHIVNISSITAHVIPEQIKEFNVYPASKSGVTGLSKTLRLDLRHAQSRIKVTNILPGQIRTNLVREFEKDDQKIWNAQPQLEPEDIAATVAYVVSIPEHVSSICPGAVRTNVVREMSDELKQMFGKIPLLEPEDVANAVAYVVSTPSHVSIAELQIVPVGEKSV